ncbi:hypothetical protein WCX18_11135 [Sulfurimonas sp. HSL1-2]|uniref:hypothetical protein n=1 Tax=Thiomicrolovo zhangzhouensis TaxID=3131933 RepID=UPI0031F823ED
MQQLLITVEIQSVGDQWQLDVINTITRKHFICHNLDEMNENIQMLFDLYEGYELQVEWLKTPLARPDHINEVRQEIDKMQHSLEQAD